MASAPVKVADAEAIPSTQDIYSQARQCQRLFEVYLKTPRAYKREVSDLQQRFLTWASFLGVFANVNASLDARLRRAPEIKELVLTMVRVLMRNLERAIRQHPPADPQTSQDGKAVNDAEITNGAIYGMTGAIDRLHRLATAIRQSPRTDEVERVLNFASKQEPDGFPTFILAIVQFLFRDAEKTLQTQLAESIIYRRHRLRWSLNHSKKLRHQRKDQVVSKPAQENTPGTIARPTSNIPLQNRSEIPSVETGSNYSSTAPSQRPLGGIVNKTHRRVQLESQQEDVTSTRSSNPPPTAQYPDVPQMAAGETKLRCKYCLMDVEVGLNPSDKKKKNIWEKHLDADMRPFVCCSEECGKFPPAFSSTRTWKIHMQETHRADWAQYIHRVTWPCPHCRGAVKPFLTEDLLVRHLKDESVDGHPKALNLNSRAMMTARANLSNPRPAGYCPLCGPPPWNDLAKMSKEPVAHREQPDKPSEESDISSGQPDTPSEEPNISSGQPNISGKEADTPSGHPKSSSEKPDDLSTHFANHLRHLAFLSLHWWDADTSETGDSADGVINSDDAIGFNSEGRRNPETNQKENNSHPLIDLDDGELEVYRKERREVEIRRIVDEGNWVEDLESLRQKVLIEVEKETHYDKRLEMITGKMLEPPYLLDKESVSQRWVEVGEVLRYRRLAHELREVQKKIKLKASLQTPTENEFKLSSDEDESTFARHLADRLFREVVKSAFQDESREFLPEGRIEDLITAETVAEALPDLNSDLIEDLSLFDFILSQAKKVFGVTVLVMFSQWDILRAMRLFELHELNDAKLPVAEMNEEASKIVPSLFTQKPWSSSSRTRFFKYQWIFLAPVFSYRKFRYNLEPDCPLPVISSASVGAFDDVVQAQIQPNHLQLRSQATGFHNDESNTKDSQSVAIKKMRVFDEHSGLDSWEAEVNVQEYLNQLNHEHIIRGIAAITKGQQRYIIFEWADGGNLRDLWANSRGNPDLSSTLIMEVLIQLQGLADALSSIHNISFAAGGYRHGDIRPENILSFPNEKSSIGTLKIANMSLARRHEEVTEYRYRTTTRYSTVAYEPPETFGLGPRSRKYDMWSMGCVVLEWMICLLYGYDELNNFNRSLGHDSSLRRHFFANNDNAEFALSRSVVVITDRIAADPECAYDTALRDLLEFVRTKLLLISPRDRATAGGFRDHLDQILLKGKESEHYLFSGRRREYPAPSLLSPKFESRPQTLESTLTLKEYRHPNLDEASWEFMIANDFAFRLVESLGAKVLEPPKSIQSTYLCPRCTELPWADWKVGRHTLIDETVSDLAATATTCVFCSLLLRTLKRSHSPSTRVRFDKVKSTIRLNDLSTPVLSIFAFPGRQMHLVPPEIQIGFPVLPQGGSKTSLAVVAQWLRECDEKHQKCVSDDPKTFMPTRVLDVIDDDPAVVRLRSTVPDELAKYIAVSHPWSLETLSFLTRQGNIEEFMRGISIDRLPTTFRDAVFTARALGIRYLWIDALCVINGSGGDFESEVSHMEDIFKCAYCVISATQAEKMSDGFLKRPGDARDYEEIVLEDTQSLYVCSFIDDFERDVLQSGLCQRAWILQERALARRTIYFTKTQVYMECGDGIRCETLTKMHNRAAAIFGDPNFPKNALITTVRDKVQLFQYVYSHYSRLLLSADKDKPHAIAGLEMRLIRAFNYGGAYGIFGGSLFYHSLVWRRAPEADSLVRIHFSTQTRSVPTWSWMAFQGPISYVEVPFHSIDWAESELQPWPLIEGSNNTNSPGGGMLIAIARDFEPIGLESNEMIIFDVPSEVVDRDVKCVILGTQERVTSTVERRHYVLFVTVVSQEESVYERVGVGYLSGLNINQESGQSIKIR